MAEKVFRPWTDYGPDPSGEWERRRDKERKSEEWKVVGRDWMA